MASWMFTLGLLSLVATVVALYPARVLGKSMPLYFFASLLQGELAPWHLILQLILAAWFIDGGALHSVWGIVGLLCYVLSWAGLVFLLVQAKHSQAIYNASLRSGLGSNYLQAIPSTRKRLLNAPLKLRHWLLPMGFRRKGVVRVDNIAYADGGKRNSLDVYFPSESIDTPRPVLLQVHGGAWVVGHKREQAMPLIHHMVSRGWVAVSINYQLSPKVHFPSHIVDVKKAIVWVKENIAQYGGDPNFICITGGSAGGHLSSLAAVTPNAAEYQPGFEDKDTAVQAAVPFYGIYDWVEEGNWRGSMAIQPFLRKYVVPKNLAVDDPLWEQASPIYQAGQHGEIPPMFLIHGENDCLVWVEDAQRMTAKLQQISKNTVVYAQLPFAQHAFEIMHSLRADITSRAVAKFLEWNYANYLQVNK